MKINLTREELSTLADMLVIDIDDDSRKEYFENEKDQKLCHKLRMAMK